jgi:hypothetical protein
MTKKVKSEHLGTYITRYNDKGFDISIVVTEKLADNAISIALQILGLTANEAELLVASEIPNKVDVF